MFVRQHLKLRTGSVSQLLEVERQPELFLLYVSDEAVTWRQWSQRRC